MRDSMIPGRKTALLRSAFLLILLLSGCAGNIIEPNRLGLLAPFEGLYRQSGYNALASVRGVVEADPRLWLPVALDTSRGGERAALKLLAPGNTSAIVGPLTPNQAAQVYPALLDVDIRWLLPFAQTMGVPVAVDSPDWLLALMDAVASGPATKFDVSRIAIAGYDPLFTMINRNDLESLLADRIESPVEWVDAPDQVDAGDLLVWLGEAADGVRFISRVRERLPETAVWLPIWTAGSVFRDHADALPAWRWDRIEWGGWLPAEGWSAETLTPEMAEGMLVDASTRHAIAYEVFTPGQWQFVSLSFSVE